MPPPAGKVGGRERLPIEARPGARAARAGGADTVRHRTLRFRADGAPPLRFNLDRGGRTVAW